LKKLAALAFATLIFVSSLVVAFSQSMSAMPEESTRANLSAIISSISANDTIIPGSENGLIVALGGIVGVVLFLTVILLMVLKKRKKMSH
jgi:hypothetical protein